MTFSGHISVAVIVLKYVPDPLTVAILNMILHMPLDGIPHAEWSTFRDSKTKMILTTAIDIIVGLMILFLAYRYLSVSLILLMVAVIGSLWLDILEILTLGKWKKLRTFHDYLHTWPEKPRDPVDWKKTVTGKTPVWVKLAIQTVLVILAMIVLIF